MAEQTAIGFDLDDPPVDPPEGCVKPGVWRLAKDYLDRHRVADSGFGCVTCPGWKTCPGGQLGLDGLRTAVGERNDNSAYWIAFAKITANATQKDAS